MGRVQGVFAVLASGVVVALVTREELHGRPTDLEAELAVGPVQEELLLVDVQRAVVLELQLLHLSSRFRRKESCVIDPRDANGICQCVAYL